MERLPAPALPDWLGRLVPFERYLVELDDGLRFHVMEHGEGRPVLLFHGLPTWSFLYRKVAAQLAGESFRLVMPDMMGLGFSSRPNPRDHSLSNHWSWMAELIRWLEIESPIAVVQDWGGPVGIGALSLLDTAPTGLVVMNTIVGPPKPDFKPTSAHRFLSSRAGELTTRYLGFPKWGLGRMQGDKKSISGEVARAYRYPLRGTESSEAVTGIVRMTPDTMDHPSLAHLQVIERFVSDYTGPAAIVWGDNDPILGRLRNRTARAIPQATVTATTAGHFLQEEVPGEIADAIRAVASR